MTQPVMQTVAGVAAHAPTGAGVAARPAPRDRLAFTAVGAGIAAMPLLQPKGPGNSAPADVFMAAAIVAVMLWASGRRIRVRFPYIVPMAMLMTAGAVAAVVSIAPSAGVKAIIQEIFLVAWCVAVATVCREPAGLAFVLRTWAISATAWASVLCVGIFSGQYWLAGVDPSVGGRARMTFDHPNLAGGFFMASLFIVVLARYPRNRAGRVACCVVLATAILFTGSNGAMLSLTIGGTVAAFVAVWRRSDLVGAIAATAVAAIMFAIGAYYVDRYQLVDKATNSAHSVLRYSVGRTERSAAGRQSLFAEQVVLFRTGPFFGRGPATTKLSLETTLTGRVHEAHNDYLATLVERGPLGVMGLLLLMGGVAVRAQSIALKPLNAAFARVVPGTAPLIGLLVAFVVSSLVREVLHYRHFWAVLGILAALYLFGRSPPEGSADAAAPAAP